MQLLTGQTVSGIDAGFNTFVTAMSIAYGLMVSAVVLPWRFTELSPHRTPCDGDPICPRAPLLGRPSSQASPRLIREDADRNRAQPRQTS
jgi:hypothetical protein